jgi:hypothetical protein
MSVPGAADTSTADRYSEREQLRNAALIQEMVSLAASDPAASQAVLALLARVDSATGIRDREGPLVSADRVAAV